MYLKPGNPAEEGNKKGKVEKALIRSVRRRNSGGCGPREERGRRMGTKTSWEKGREMGRGSLSIFRWGSLNEAWYVTEGKTEKSSINRVKHGNKRTLGGGHILSGAYEDIRQEGKKEATLQKLERAWTGEQKKATLEGSFAQKTLEGKGEKRKTHSDRAHTCVKNRGGEKRKKRKPEKVDTVREKLGGISSGALKSKNSLNKSKVV